ncbi:MAG: helix-turn-helix transcriptional regulator [Solirubrobacterales bacterium]|nr:helix-turn-helix transcriptional regulator [Solirubrobacterales bacterium]MCB0861194.1 helix-turn-helix transcriptional regulator [Solirubrobacterales bacterium]HRV60383.1 XRE family transcriptional regulator [Solirubrobacterales bacterium]
MSQATVTDPESADAPESASGAAENPVGARVKALREAMGFSLRDLSERSGVSPTMLSQVERGSTSPTLAVAEKIAAGLDLSLSQLLRLDEVQHVVVSRSGDHLVRNSKGHRIEELTPPLPGQRADVSTHRLEPGAVTGGADDAPMHEPGSRETAVVIEGELVLVFEGEPYRLSGGDSVTFDADLPHHFENESDQPVEFIAVIAAGLRRG